MLRDRSSGLFGGTELTPVDEDLPDEELDSDAEGADGEEDEFADEASEDAEVEGFDEGDVEEEGDDEGVNIDEVVELSSKEQSARSLEIRRAIEERMEEKQMHEDLDYLDYDLDD